MVDTPLSEHVYCVASHSKWLSEKSDESASNFVLSLNIPPWKLFRWFRRPQLWDRWLAASSQCAHSCITSPADFLGKTSNHPGDSAPLQPTFGILWLLAFPKLVSPLIGKRFQNIDEIQESMTEQLVATGRTVWGPKVPTLKGTEASLSCAQCFLYLVSSSINVSIFHIHGRILFGHSWYVYSWHKLRNLYLVLLFWVKAFTSRINVWN